MNEDKERKSEYYPDIPFENYGFYWVPRMGHKGEEEEWGLQQIPMSDVPWDTRPFYTKTGRIRSIEEGNEEER